MEAGTKHSPEALVKMSVSQVQRHGEKADRFWDQVDKDGPLPELRPELGQCWVWKEGSAFTYNGYGRFDNGKAHVKGYIIQGGVIPRGFDLDHLCRTRACIRKSHLEPVTRKVNIRRAYASRREEDSWMEDSSTW